VEEILGFDDIREFEIINDGDIEKILADEDNRIFIDNLKHVLKAIGAEKIAEFGPHVAGSQDIYAIRMKIGEERFSIIIETYCRIKFVGHPMILYKIMTALQGGD
jgi:hypothetical protein